jgi:hypothetical protein
LTKNSDFKNNLKKVSFFVLVMEVNISNVDSNDNRKYVFTILKIILLTNLPALVFMVYDFKSSIGWVTGSLASAVNFWFMAQHTYTTLQTSETNKAGAKRTSKSFIFRFIFLIGWSVFVLAVIKAEVISYCVALFTAQFVIVFYHIYESVKKSKFNKYFDDARGEDG